MNLHQLTCEICGRSIGVEEHAYAVEILDDEGYTVNVDACTDCKSKDGDKIFDFEEIVCSECGEEAPVVSGIYDEVGWVQHEYGWRCPKDSLVTISLDDQVSFDETLRLTSAIDQLVKELPAEDQFRVAMVRAVEEYLNLIGVEFGVEDYANTLAETALETMHEWLGKK